MHPSARFVIATALASVLLVSCGYQEDSAGQTSEVPSGVAEEYATMAEEIDSEGGEETRGGWRVGYIVEAAEPWFESQHGSQHFRAPKAGETHHIEILPFEKSTGRLVPDTPVRLEILDADGTVVQDRQLQFLYGEFFHYATNFSIPEPGTYTLRATIGAPTFSRHGEHGDTPAMSDGTTVIFEGVELEPA
jgi:Fe2+ transport protein